MLARVQDIEIGNTVNPKDDSFAINELICSTPRTTRRVLQTSQKCPETAGLKWRGLQNRVRDFKDLGRKPLCYRYAIPQWTVEQFQ